MKDTIGKEWREGEMKGKMEPTRRLPQPWIDWTKISAAKRDDLPSKDFGDREAVKARASEMEKKGRISDREAVKKADRKLGKKEAKR